jgi:hypothetical protein
MCLGDITQGPNPIEEGSGWKVFEVRDNGGLASPYFTFVAFPESEWLKDYCDLVISIENIFCPQSYNTGYHFFEKKEDADALADDVRRYSIRPVVVRKVRYKNVTAKGSQPVREFTGCIVYFPCVVAKEIFIEPEEEQKECA